MLRIVGLLLSLHNGAGVSLLGTVVCMRIGCRLLRMILRVGVHDEEREDRRAQGSGSEQPLGMATGATSLS